MAVNPTPPVDNSAEPKQIHELPDVANPGAQLAGSYLEIEIPVVAGPNQPPSYVNKRLAFGALVQVLRGATASGNDQKGTQDRIVLYESSATPGAGAADSTLDRLAAAALCVGVRALVLLPQPHDKYLAADPTGPLTVAVDGNFSGPTTKARWVDAEDVAASGVPAYSPLKAEYALGEQVNYRVNRKLSLFAATKLLRRVDFPGNVIPPPTGVAGDEDWEPLGYDAPGAAYIGFQRITVAQARATAGDEAVRENRLYRLFRYDKDNDEPLPDVLVLGLSATQFSPTAWLLPLDGSAPEEGTFVLGSSGQGTFTPRTSGPGGLGYTDAQADARISAATANNLTTTAPGKVLDARQGRALALRLTTVEGDLTDAENDLQALDERVDLLEENSEGYTALLSPVFVKQTGGVPLGFATIAQAESSGSLSDAIMELVAPEQSMPAGLSLSDLARLHGNGTLLSLAGSAILPSEVQQVSFQDGYILAGSAVSTRIFNSRLLETQVWPAGKAIILDCCQIAGTAPFYTHGVGTVILRGSTIIEAGRLPDPDTTIVDERGAGSGPEPGGSVAWSDITDKPSTFTPSAHTHPISQVTGLTAALGGKADLVGGVVPYAQLPPPLNRITFPFPAGQTTTYDVVIAFLEMAGTYAVESQNGVKLSGPAPVYTVNGALANPPLNVVVGDTIAITAATPAGVKGYLVLRSQ